jgi:hypothetical protein
VLREREYDEVAAIIRPHIDARVANELLTSREETDRSDAGTQV